MIGQRSRIDLLILSYLRITHNVTDTIGGSSCKNASADYVKGYAGESNYFETDRQRGEGSRVSDNLLYRAINEIHVRV